MNRNVFIAAITGTILYFVVPGMTNAAGQWPKSISTVKGSALIYQLQPDSLVNGHLYGRAALSVTLKGEKTPLFGAMWFDARIRTDRENDMCSLGTVKVTGVRFAGSDTIPPEKKVLLKSFVEGEVPAWEIIFPLDDLRATLYGNEPWPGAAAIDEQIPQTATVDRMTAQCTVIWDGDPKFRQIPGTDLYRGLNTSGNVLIYGKECFVCEAGIWFTGESPSGPWQVSTSVPREIQRIPASDPAYNVKYVHIFDVQPEVVFMGYTPGYLEQNNKNINRENLYSQNNSPRIKLSPSPPAANIQPSTLPGAGSQPRRQQSANMQVMTATHEQNNVYTDLNGNVYRLNMGNWERNTGGSNWSIVRQPAIQNEMQEQETRRKRAENMVKW